MSEPVIEPMAIEPVVAAIVTAIIRDLSDRRGLRHEWEQIDDDVRKQIVLAWQNLARDHVRAAVLMERDRCLDICTNVEPADGVRAVRQAIYDRIASGE